MPVIRQLSTSVVNKIAAGEVIERPASVVKELLENALDAGSTRVEVTLGQGGAELVRVADDGCGIDADQLPLAVASHATSKITSADDLFRVGTLGFRGEALASIAEVSHLLIRSRTAESNSGNELRVTGGAAEPVAPCGCPQGTVIEVRNLFYNTPVRRKYLRTTPTELSHSTEAFTRLALAHPHVHMTLKHNERVVHDLPASANWRERIAAFFGPGIADGLIPIESHDQDVHLSGYAVDPAHSRSHNRMQYLFLNGRHIRDRALQHALTEAYRGLLLSGRYPIAFLQSAMPADTVDVNVHPTKLEVRFQDSGRLYSQLLGSLRKKFLTTDLSARVRSPEKEPAAAEAPGYDAGRADAHRRELVEWATGQLSQQSTALAGQAAAPAGQREFELAYSREQSDTLLPLSREWPAAENANSASSWKPQETAPEHDPAGGYRSESGFQRQSETHEPWRVRGLQVHDRYIVTESREGMVVIDQHALHERILYEQIREKVLSGKLETQKLLVPEPVHLTAEEAAAALQSQELLAQLGMQVEAFGGDTVLVSSYPAMLANFSPADVLRQIVDHLLTGGGQPDRRDLIDELLHMIACKAAIKAGDRLTPEEISALIGQRHLCQDAHHCPHGRPTSLVFSREELDKRFKRT